MSKSYLHCLVLPFLFAVLAFSQQAPTPASAPGPQSATAATPEAREGHIQLDVVVTDRSGKPVSGLGLDDFTLLDSNQNTKILSFHAVDGSAQKTDPPVEVILLIDAENLGPQGIANVCQQLKRFLQENGGHLARPVTLFVLTNQGLDALPEPSVDGNELVAKVSDVEDRLHGIGLGAGNNGPVERLQFSVQTLSAIADHEAKKPGRKLLIWAGSGWPMFDSNRPPTPSKAQLQFFFNTIVQLSTRLREARISVYSVSQGTSDSVSQGTGDSVSQGPVNSSSLQGPAAVDYGTGYGISQGTGLDNMAYEGFLRGVKTPEDANTANLGLKVMAVQSGGRVLGPNGDLATQIDRCIQDASAFYTLSFDPPRAGHANEYRDLRVKIDRPKLTARTYTGYYNQPESASSATNIQPGSGSRPVDQRASSDLDVNRPAASAAKPVTVAQLEQVMKEVQGQPDSEAARQLSGLVLTERLSSARLSAWKASLPGAKAQHALVALADASAFLAPPAAEIPANAPPDLAAQRQMMARTIEYLGKTIPMLPNFFATRLTEHYEESPQKSRKAGMANPIERPSQFAGSSSATVLYRGGHEVVDADAAKDKKPNAKTERLNARGTFGPILSVVIKDAADGHLKWDRWEQGEDRTQAVFRLAVPKEKSHYLPGYDSSFFRGESDDLQQPTGYHGEIAVDPATGAILRLVVEADFEPGSPMVRADIFVEYGSVEIGGKTYICPLRSVSISRGPSFLGFDRRGKQILGPATTMLNDVAFGGYHVFRSELRVLSGNDPALEGK